MLKLPTEWIEEDFEGEATTECGVTGTKAWEEDRKQARTMMKGRERRSLAPGDQ